MADLIQKTQAKTAMLLELESIKGLLQEEDDIPILQEVAESNAATPFSHLLDMDQTQDEELAFDMDNSIQEPIKGRHFVEQQQDFFHNDTQHAPIARPPVSKPELTQSKPALKKPTGENPFLPEHIRARLHGNNPPPSFEQMTANRIAQTHKPSRLLGASSSTFAAASARENLINDVIDKFLPEIEVELRERLEKMTEQQLDELRKG